MHTVSSFVIRHSSFRGRSRGAFTLLELMLVMAIIAFTIALAAPSLAGFARARLVSDTAGQFTAMASYARSHAISDGQPYRLVLDTNARQFSITKGSGDGQTFVAVDEPGAKPFELPKDIEVATDAAQIDDLPTIVFQPEGRTDVATFTFSDPYGNNVEVRCDTTFGYYRIVTGPDRVEDRP